MSVRQALTDDPEQHHEHAGEGEQVRAEAVGAEQGGELNGQAVKGDVGQGTDGQDQQPGPHQGREAAGNAPTRRSEVNVWVGVAMGRRDQRHAASVASLGQKVKDFMELVEE